MTITIQAPRYEDGGDRDATAAIQAAIDSARGDGRTVVLPAGRYRITAPLDIIDDGATAGQGMRGVRLIGENAGVNGFASTYLEWDGPDDLPMLRLFSRECMIEGLGFRARYGRRALVGIDIDKSTLTGALPCTNNAVTRCQFVGLGGNWGAMTYGVRVGHSGAYNCEYMTLDCCYFTNIGETAYFVDNATGQAKYHRLERNAFDNSPRAVQFLSGSFTARNSSFGRVGTCFHLRAPCEPIIISGVDCERSGRLLDTSSAGTSSPWPIKIEGARFALVAQSSTYPNGAPPDGDVIKYSNRGPLMLDACMFERGGTTADDAFGINTWCNVGNTGAILMARGCWFPNAHPFRDVGPHTRYIEGCFYDVVNATGVRTAMAPLNDERRNRYPR